MIQSLMLFLAPETTPQATLRPPPAVAVPAQPLAARRSSLLFGVRVLGNSLGFCALLGACWFFLQLMQLVLSS
jgi:hypothetical protein